MILPDVNILIFAYNSDSPHHVEARQWWEDALNSARPVGLSWSVMLGFLRLITHRGLSTSPLAPRDAVNWVRAWLACPQVQILSPGENHQEILFDLLIDLGTAGNLTTDAHLAALAIEHHGEVASADADFGRFQGLRWFNPLRPAARKR